MHCGSTISHCEFFWRVLRYLHPKILINVRAPHNLINFLFLGLILITSWRTSFFANFELEFLFCLLMFPGVYHRLLCFFKAPKSTGESCKNSNGHSRWPRAQRRWDAEKSEERAYRSLHTHTPHTYTHAPRLGINPGATPGNSALTGLEPGRAARPLPELATGPLVRSRLLCC